MKTTLLSKWMFRAVLLLFAASWASVSAQAADSLPATPAPGSDTTSEPRIAAGAVEDTLTACMGRIPKDAVGCAGSRDDLPVQLPAEPQDLWQDEVHTSVSLSIVDVTRRERLCIEH
jgi:hypothetical protein